MTDDYHNKCIALFNGFGCSTWNCDTCPIMLCGFFNKRIDKAEKLLIQEYREKHDRS